MKVLMICHDDQIDRRILAQAESLIAHGHEVKILSLSAKSGIEQGAIVAGIFSSSYQGNRSWLAFRLLMQKIHLGSALTFVLQRLRRYPKLHQFLEFFLHLKPFCKGYFQYRCQGETTGLLDDFFDFRLSIFEMAKGDTFDVIQVHDLPLLEVGYRLAQIKDVPLVYDAHEWFPEQAHFSKFWKRVLTQSELRFIKKCAAVFTVNESIAAAMQQRYQILKPVVLLNAVDRHDAFDLQHRYDLFREKLPELHGKKIVLFQGGLSERRNLENLITAFALVKDPQAILLLMGNGGMKATCITLAKTLQLYQKRVYFFSAVPQEDLLYYTASADLGVIPYPPIDLNTYYCTPNKLFEFIQAGLPILANDLPELRRFVQDNHFGMVHSMNTAKEIAAAIDLALQRMAECGWRENLLKNHHLYTWKEQENIYLATMNQVFATISKNEVQVADVV